MRSNGEPDWWAESNSLEMVAMMLGETLKASSRFESESIKCSSRLSSLDSCGCSDSFPDESSVDGLSSCLHFRIPLTTWSPSSGRPPERRVSRAACASWREKFGGRRLEAMACSMRSIRRLCSTRLARAAPEPIEVWEFRWLITPSASRGESELSASTSTSARSVVAFDREGPLANDWLIRSMTTNASRGVTEPFASASSGSMKLWKQSPAITVRFSRFSRINRRLLERRWDLSNLLLDLVDRMVKPFW